MKKLLYSLSIYVLLTACTSSKEGPETNVASPDSVAVATVQSPKESEAVGIWDKISVRDTPSEDGKWLTSISLGERLTFLNEEATDKEGKIYYKIRLNDGKEGWVRHEFIVPEAQPAVFLHNTTIYNRPDLLTKSNKEFSKMDIAAVKQEQDGWVEVTGKRTGAKWIDSGWIKSDNLSFDQVDIAMAKFAKPALESDDPAEKIEKLQEIIDNVDLSSSVFAISLKEALDELQVEQQMEVKYDEHQPDTLNTENEI